MRRRCLVFEIAGAPRKNFGDDSNSISSNSSRFDEKNASDDKQLVRSKPGNGSSPCILPGIGLHLNALASTSKDCRVVKHEILASGRQLISMPSSVTFNSVSSGQILLNKASAMNSMETDTGPADSGDLVDASQASTFGINEEFNQGSPKKKRHVSLLNFSLWNYCLMISSYPAFILSHYVC